MTILLKSIGNFFLGVLYGLIIELTSSLGLSYLLQTFHAGNFDQLIFDIWLPLLIVLFFGIYCIFFRKKYAIILGMFSGCLLFIFSLGILLTGT